MRGRVMRATPRPMVPGRGMPIRVGGQIRGGPVRGGPTIRGATIIRGGARLPINIRPVAPGGARPSVRPGNVRPMMRPGARPMMRPVLRPGMRPGMSMRPVRPINGGVRPMMRPQVAANQPKINIVFEPQQRAPVSP